MSIPIQLTNFSPLKKDMCLNHVDREQFHFTFAGCAFDAIFSIDKRPYELLIGMMGTGWATVCYMLPGYYTAMNDADFFDLRHLLHLRKDSDEELTSWKFLIHVDCCVPRYSRCKMVDPDKSCELNQNAGKDIPDGDKTHFFGWNDHQKDHRKARNFEKTEMILGKEVADYCRENNISSKWTAKSN